MTQSGQGEEPSARVAREGIVLPSDGGEPLLPGMTGAQGAPQHPTPPPAPAAPSGGQAWHGSWGPEQQQPQAAPPAQGWTAPPAQPWAGPDQQPAAPSWSTPENPSQPLPPETPSYDDRGAGALPPATPYGDRTGTYGDQATPYEAPSGSFGGQGAGALPPAVPNGTQGASAFPAAGPFGDEGATQYIPPVVDEAATQYIPPVGGGALPPEVTPEPPGESTTVLGRVPRNAAPAPAAAGPDAEPTQLIPPVPAADGGERQPPAEFDNLFRSEGGARPQPAGATQQLPRFQQPQPQQPQFIPRRETHDEEPRRGSGRTGSRVPLFAAVGVGIAVLGIGAGALMGSGGGDGDDDNKTVAATAPASESASASPSPSVDPVQQQAVELDKLLAVSGNSRTMVINAVSDVRSCTNLSQAAKDLRDAAKQRDDLVTKLGELSVDKLPQNAELTTALTKAWEASASADNHYAAWADQVAQRQGKMCKKGQARNTPQTAAGNRASGTASAEKNKAAGLWNSIAKQYGLTERTATQL
ncbi:hypothetical protein Stsp02_65590 [Streptomyces sp. NBRC 14336]|uniref:hypothetical protein n=1 Tax=Streptomyces sp. NBRC 14336 TaxID=3030992 RepID=UPI0024A3E373|nr:hypothetical protein [Streptomyces sp. NBRC 14336]GLW50898.1 hypothetical protein Stsp02_65590 [Streptomyces sp. NBRC 14336]